MKSRHFEYKNYDKKNSLNRREHFTDTSVVDSTCAGNINITSSYIIRFLSTALLLVSIIPYAGSQSLSSTLIPAPKKMIRQQPDVVIGSMFKSQFVICVGDRSPVSDLDAARWLVQRSFSNTELLPILKESEVNKSGLRFRNLIVLGSPESSTIVNTSTVRLTVEMMPAGGYVIRIFDTPEGQLILVAGRDQEGVWNGTSTISQLIRRSGDQILLSRVEIDDWPDIPLRGVNQMLDYLLPPNLPHKAFVEGILDYRQMIDRMVEVKLNALIIHAADALWRIPRVTKKWPRTYSEYRGADFWREKVQEIVAYAHSRNVKVYLLLFHTLDGQGKVKIENSDICGTDPENKAGLLRQFETYTQWFPDLDGYAIHRSEHKRCSCSECAKVLPSEEFLQYINHYSAIIRKYSPSAILAFCPFPDTYYPYLVKNKHRLPEDARNFLWASQHSGQNSFLASIKYNQEYSWFDDFKKNWYWLYTNALLDIPLPQAEYFQEVAQYCASKRVEAIMGEFTFGRATDYNSLALAQYTWNTRLPVEEFRKLAVEGIYGNPADLDLIAIHRLFEETVAAYVRLHLDAKKLGLTSGALSKQKYIPAIDSWRYQGNQWLSKELAELKSNIDRICLALQKALNTSGGIEALRLHGWAHDARILGLEIELRQKVLEAFLRYQSATGSQEKAVLQREIAEASHQIEKAKSLSLLIEQERAERGLLIVAPYSYTPRQTVAVEKLSEIVNTAVNQVFQGVPVTPNLWEDGDILFRYYQVW